MRYNWDNNRIMFVSEYKKKIKKIKIILFHIQLKPEQ